MAVKTSTHEQLKMVESDLVSEDNKKVSDIEPETEDSEKGVNIADCIDDMNVFPSTLTGARQVESSTQELPWILEANLESKDTKTLLDIEQLETEEDTKSLSECGNISNCVGDGNGLPSTCVEENLLTISSAVVHMVDGEWSAEVCKADFSIVRHTIQGSTDLAIVAKIGETLRWPVSKEVRALKVDKLRYLFFILTPDVEAFEIVQDTVILSDVTPAEVLSYVVSFQGGNESSSLYLLDELLEQHAQFTDSSLEIDSEIEDDYNSMLAKSIAAGTGQLLKGLHFCIGAYSSQLQRGGKLLMDRMEPKCQSSDVTKSSELNSDGLIKAIQRLKKLSKTTERISDDVLIGIYSLATGIVNFVVSRTVNQSNAGEKFSRALPVEMLIVSWDSFNKLFEAVEESLKDALVSTSAVATEIVRHRFGETVGRFTEETLAVAGHTMATAYNLAKLINLASMGVSYLGKTLNQGAKLINPASMGVSYLGKTLNKGAKLINPTSMGVSYLGKTLNKAAKVINPASMGVNYLRKTLKKGAKVINPASMGVNYLGKTLKKVN